MIYRFVTIFAFFALMAAGAVLIVLNVLRRHSKGRALVHVSIPASMIAVGLLLLILIPGSFHTVEAGTVAVVKEMGVIAEVESPGTYFDFWLTRKYENYDSKPSSPA